MKLTNNRLHALDNLRALLALLGIPFHVIFFLFVYVALASEHTLLDPNHFLLEPVPNAYHWAFLAIFYLHTFRMPTFFLLAGFFAHYLYEKVGVQHFFKNRILRVGIPFLFFMVWIIPSYLETTFLVALHQKIALSNAIKESYQSGAMWHFLSNTRSYWFLYDLIWFYVLTGGLLLVNHHLLHSKAVRDKLNTGFKNIFLTTKVYWVMPAICSILLIAGRYWYAILDESLLPSLSLLTFYSIWYLLGWGLWLHKELLADFVKAPWLKMLLSIIIYAAYLALYLKFINTSNTIAYSLAIVCYATAMTLGVWAIIGIAWRYFTHYRAPLKYISEASYWIYLIQVPLLLYIIPIVVNLTSSFMLQFIVSCVTCMTLCLASFHFLGRYTWLGYILGIKSRHKKIKN